MANGINNGIKNGNGINNGNGNGFNHNTQLPSPLKSRSFWINVVFYFFLALLLVSILLYAFFVLRVYLQKKKISEIDDKIATYGTKEQKANEKQVLDYKKKIDDFAIIINNHRISSNIFGFVEDKTLPSVWFSNFDMSESSNEIRLTGEAESMETLSRQVKTFEESKDYVKSISVLSSQTESDKKIRFILNLILDPKIFNYNNAVSLTPVGQ